MAIIKFRKQKKNISYRSRSSYISKDPDKRASSLANLVHSKKRVGVKVETNSVKWTSRKLDQADIIEFTEDCLGISLHDRPGQEVMLRALYGLPMTDEQIELYQYLTSPKNEYIAGTILDEACWILGRRSGKSLLSAIIALYEATRKKWQKYLMPGEIGYVILIATRERQSIDIIGTYVRTLLENSKIAHLIQENWSTSLLLTTGIKIESFPCNSTASRGYPTICMILDEVAHYSTTGPKADKNVYDAIKPAMLQFADAYPKLLLISSPAAKQGLLYEQFSQGFLVPNRLTVQAQTRAINPKVSQSFINAEYKRDPDYASRKYGAEFAEEMYGFFASCSDELAACYTLGSAGTEDTMPYNSQNKYFAASDQSGLSGQDRWTFSICHNDTRANKNICDVHKTWSTRHLDVIIPEIVLLLQQYRIGTLFIDRYAKGFVEDLFRQKKIQTILRDLLPALYSQFKLLVISGKVALPDFLPLKTGLSQTTAYYGKNNNLSVSHPRDASGHSDLADAVVTAIVAASKHNVFYEVPTPERQRELDAMEEQQDSYDVLTWGL